MVSESYAYVAAGDAGLRVIHIANPAAPVEVGSYDSPGTASAVAISGHYAYLADGSAGLRVVNVTNPADPTFVQWCDTDGAVDVVVTGSYAYVVNGGSGLCIVNIANPAAPTLAGTLDTLRQARGVAANGSLVYVADEDVGLRIINVANPAAPAEIGRWEPRQGEYSTFGPVMNVAIQDDYAYVVEARIDRWDPDFPNLSPGRLSLVDVTDPTAPVLVGSCHTYGSPVDVVAAGNYAYVADGFGGLRIMDTTRAGFLYEVTFADSTGTAMDVTCLLYTSPSPRDS